MAARTITKRCPQCKQTFPATTEFFHRDRTRTDGMQCYCKQCRLKSRKMFYRVHQLEHLHHNHQYYKDHRGEIRQQQKQYRKTIRGHLRSVWLSMIDRCNPKFRQFKDYGGRGIKITFACFEDFHDYVVKELKADPRGLTIDRINNDGHYEPGNIRFVSQAENNRNKRRK